MKNPLVAALTVFFLCTSATAPLAYGQVPEIIAGGAALSDLITGLKADRGFWAFPD